ncbi:Linear gramicidin synthase subunit D [Legionella massiliensis]|uniref:Linear gramicidin synthase subunit D n=1 Tax=Legionella massiliensis TaxID=1034943 RepID=A0A078L0Z0_9GAMM|nr:thioester reductase domain-containing protein [Legionella massiliensis]CDZ77704.1 Linear gramicidin synthase subunit D [Legionella massiliensis]CEE13442.1 Linear gramicidin synthase subunit D [Legionella massiliensis]
MASAVDIFGSHSVNDLWGNFVQVVNQRPSHTALTYYSEHAWHSITYKKLYHKIMLVQEQLRQIGIQEGERVVLFPRNDPSTIIHLFALFSLRATAVLMDIDMPQPQLEQMLEQLETRVLMMEDSLLAKLSANQLKKHLILSLNTVPCHINTDYAQKILDFRQSEIDPNIALILFTSGTTGNFHGVCLSHRSLLTGIYLTDEWGLVKTGEERMLAFLPLYHVYPLVSNLLTGLFHSCEMALVKHLDFFSLSKVMHKVKPTLVVAVPRILELFHQKIKQEIQSLSGLKKQIAVSAFSDGSMGKFLKFIKINTLLSKQLKSVFGGEVRCFIAGGAKLSYETEAFFSAFIAPVYQGYGLTEVSGACVSEVPNHTSSGSVGQFGSLCEIRIDNPDEQGEGEVCLKGGLLMEGYFKAESGEGPIQEGWFHTGDLGFLDDKGFLRITGRIKELIVLSNGKKVSPSLVESLYKDIPHVKELIVLGMEEPEQGNEHICALVVKSNEIDEENKLINEAINERSSTLPFHMRINKVYFVDEIIRTNTMKVRYAENKKRLLSQLQVASNDADIMSLGDGYPTTLPKLLTILSEITGIPANKIDPDKTLADLGMDSLQFSVLFTQLFIDFPGASLSIEKLYKQDIREIAQHLHDQKDEEAAPIILPKLAEEIRPLNPPQSQIDLQNILLTGASGFLGAYLLFYLLTKTKADVFCLVRADNAEHAMKRIRKNCKKYGIWQEYFTERIVPVAGDLSQARFALSQERYDELAEQIDVVLHSGALVNFVLPYEALVPTNVLGTEEILRFACHKRDKPVEHISTYSVLDSSVNGEEAPVLAEPSSHMGYVQSKWAAEQLVYEAMARGMQINIHRAGNVYGDSMTGRYNHNDFTTCLLVAALQLGVYVPLDVYVDIAPVDYVARATIYTMMKRDYSQFYHWVNPVPVHLTKLMKYFKQEGFKLEPVDQRHWIQAILSHPECALYQYVPILLGVDKNKVPLITKMLDMRKIHVQTAHSLQVLSESKLHCPQVDEKLIRVYLTEIIANYPELKF